MSVSNHCLKEHGGCFDRKVDGGAATPRKRVHILVSYNPRQSSSSVAYHTMWGGVTIGYIHVTKQSE